MLAVIGAPNARGSGKAARDWDAYHRLVATLRRLEGDETLLVQSGKPVGVFRTHPDAPRVLIANALLVPAWADWEHFRRYEAMGLTMYGQMTAGSWIYIGTQGILQGTYETFGACARRHFGGSLAGRLVLSAGLGGMGGAQPLAITMNGGVGLIVEVDRERIERRHRLGYVDRWTASLDEAVGWAEQARRRREPTALPTARWGPIRPPRRGRPRPHGSGARHACPRRPRQAERTSRAPASAAASR